VNSSVLSELSLLSDISYDTVGVVVYCIECVAERWGAGVEYHFQELMSPTPRR